MSEAMVPGWLNRYVYANGMRFHEPAAILLLFAVVQGNDRTLSAAIFYNITRLELRWQIRSVERGWFQNRPQLS